MLQHNTPTRLMWAPLCLFAAFAVFFSGCGVETVMSRDAAGAPKAAAAGPRWSVVPIPRTNAGAGSLVEAWIYAADLVGPSGTVSLIGNSMAHFWSAPLEYLITATGMSVFPQLAFPYLQIPPEPVHRALAVSVADVLRPEWFNICVECHELLLDEQFVGRLDRIRDAVKSVSPATRVYISVQYEMALWLNDLEDLVAAWPGADAIGLSTYPQVYHPDVPGIGYYDEFLAAAGGKPIVVAEAGWNLTGDGDANRQVAFLRLLRQLGAKHVNYYYLFDAGMEAPFFGAMGLVSGDGVPRPAYDEFRRLARMGAPGGSIGTIEPSVSEP